MYMFVMKRDLQMTCTYFFNQKVIWWRPHVWPAMLWLWRIWEVRLRQRKGSLTVNIKRPKSLGLPRWHSGEESTCQCRRRKRRGFNSLGQNTGVGSLSLLQEIFPTQGSSPGLPHCRRILYCLSHQGRWYLSFSAELLVFSTSFPTFASLNQEYFKPSFNFYL